MTWHGDSRKHSLARKGVKTARGNQIKAKPSEDTIEGIPLSKKIDGHKFTLRKNGQYQKDFNVKISITEEEYVKWKELLDGEGNPKDLANEIANFDKIEFELGATRGGYFDIDDKEDVINDRFTKEREMIKRKLELD